MARQFRSDDSSVWPYRFGSGTDGSKTVSGNSTYDGANVTCTGSSGGTSLTLGSASTFANGDLVLIHQSANTGAGNWELNRIASGGGSTSLTMSLTLENTYSSGAQIVELKEYTSVTVNSGITWSAPAWNGSVGGIIAFLCSGTTTVTGTISASEKGFRGAAQAHTGGVGRQGEGHPGTGSNSSSANGNGGGGTADYNAGAGAGGGNGTAGSNGAGSGGTGGSVVGNASLTSMFFGGGGGMAYNNSQYAPVPNPGGGVVVVISRVLSVSGAIVNSGGNGGNSSGTVVGSGGSAGGSTLLKGNVLTLGTSLVTASAGSAGTGGLRDGGAGGVGRVHADYALAVSGTTSPTIDTDLDSSLADPSGFFFNMI